MIDPITFSATPVLLRCCVWFTSDEKDRSFIPLPLKQAAANNNLVIVREYGCLDIPTDRNIVRKRVISDLKRSVIGAIIAPSLSTIARSHSELQDLASAIGLAGGRLILTDDNLDTDRSGAQAFANVLLATAMWRASINGRDARNQLISYSPAPVQRVAAAPFGFWWSDGRLEPHPLEAPIRLEMYTLFASLRDLAEVTTSLNSRGRRLRRKRRFTPAEVKRMIQDPVSMGLYRGNCKHHHNVDAQAAASSVSVHPIVTKELWSECNNLIDSISRA